MLSSILFDIVDNLVDLVYGATNSINSITRSNIPSINFEGGGVLFNMGTVV